MEYVRAITRIEMEMDNGKTYCYEVPSVKAIDAPSQGWFRIVFDDNQLEIFPIDKMIRYKMWLKDVPKLISPTTAEVIDFQDAKKKNSKAQK